MSRLIAAILVLLAAPSWATNRTVSLTWEPGDSWLTAAGGSYLNLDIDEATAPRRLAIRFFNYGEMIGEIWDDPTNRAVNISFDMGNSPIAHIRGQAVAYECGPWQASTAYALDDQVCNGSTFPSSRFSMVATTAGTSGTEEPEWPLRHPLYLALADTLDLDGVAVDNGDGTVSIPVTGHLYHEGYTVVIAGSVAYDGTYTLGDQTSGGENLVVITATYTAETFLGTETIARANSSAIDNGDGTVGLPCPGHGFTAGQSVEISGTTNYDGSYTLPDQTSGSEDVVVITATYVAEAITGGSIMAPTVTDGTVVWTFTAQDPELQVLTSEPTRRIIGRANGTGGLGQSGTKFRLGNN